MAGSTRQTARKHLPLDGLKDIRKLKGSEIKPEPVELAAKLAISIEALKEEPDHDQCRAKEELEARQIEDRYCEDSWPTQGEIEDYFDIFDRLFFLGSLEGSVLLTLVPQLIWHDQPLNLANGLTTTSEEVGVCCAYVKVQVWDRKSKTRDFETKRRKVLTTLLHEMVHAVQSIYSCDCENCRASDCEHGPAWLMVIKELQSTIGHGSLPLGDQYSPYDFGISRYLTERQTMKSIRRLAKVRNFRIRRAERENAQGG